MNQTLVRQLAIDFCCTEADVTDDRNHFTEHQYLPGRRKFLEGKECFLKIAVINGKLLFCGNKRILAWCEEQYKNTGSEWFFEAKNLRKLNDRLGEEGYQIETAHPFFVSETPSVTDTKDYTFQWYEGDEIEQFRGDERYDEAYAFCEDAPDVLGVAALCNGEIIGMAGASADSADLWQIGINVEKGTRRSGVGKMLVILLKNEILKRGHLPYYGTSMSHIASQRVALGAGFVPEWAELATSKIEEKTEKN